MRLGQFARKYDIRVQDIISYLEKESKDEIHSNTKLSNEEELDILDFFGIEAENESEIIENNPQEEIEEIKSVNEGNKPSTENIPLQKEETKPASPLDDIASVEGEIEFLQPESEQEQKVIHENEEEQVMDQSSNVPIRKEKKSEPKEDEVIDTDSLLAMLESEEVPADLDKIKLIKAPKKELAGLKMVGKIDLPEPKKKETKDEEAEEKKERSNRNKRPQLSEEEKEKRRLKYKKKQEQFEAREAKRKKEKEERERRERNASHYKQKLVQPKPKKLKQKSKKKPQEQPVQKNHLSKKIAEKKPTSFFGKLKNWLTNPDQ